MGLANLHLGLVLATVVLTACSGSLGGSSPGGTGTDDAADFDAYGAAYQGDGVQCGAIVCSGSQQCCLVYIAGDANPSGPTHACDQDCESICADTCPDAGGMTQSFPPSAASMPGMPAAGSMPSIDGATPMGSPMPMSPAGGMAPGPNPPGSSGAGPFDADTD